MSFSESLVSSISKIVDSYSSKEIYMFVDNHYYDAKFFDSLENLVKYVFDFISKDIGKVKIYSTTKSNTLNVVMEYKWGYTKTKTIYKRGVNDVFSPEVTKPDEIVLEVTKKIWHRGIWKLLE